MFTLKAVYFIYYAAAASLVPFLTLYYQDLGLTGREIGLLTGISPLTTLVGASVWSALADLTQKHRTLFLVAIGGTWVSVLLLSQIDTFLWLIPAVAAYAFFVAPLMPLVDNTVMVLLGKEKNAYGRFRVWGAYGWGIIAGLIGWLLQQAGLHWIFYSYLGFLLILFVLAWRLPIQQTSPKSNFWQGLRHLLTNPRWVLFLTVALVEGMSLGIFLNYLFLHLESMGASRVVMGLSLTVATLSEIPIFLNSRRLLRGGAPFLLAVSLAIMVVRAFAYANMTAAWQVLLISLLHGPTFSAMWSAGVAYADETAVPGLSATAQGIFSGTVLGLGSALGALVGGFLYESSGAVVAFQWAGWATLAALILFVGVNRQSLLMGMGHR